MKSFINPGIASKNSNFFTLDQIYSLLPEERSNALSFGNVDPQFTDVVNAIFPTQTQVRCGEFYPPPLFTVFISLHRV